ncbi:MAG TPA: polysaccharide biosynthesis/export family protein, partial [Brumimicrobium sp.]|nr:polysaccharide biosynthesis/export family protein [Brumimicrobium sp.]
LYVEGGARVIDFTAGVGMDGNNAQMTRSTVLDYTVRPDGTVELPVVGWVELEGLSIVEAQEKLKVLYAENYIDPFIQVEVTNRRVIVFPGSGGSAKVVPITNENTTLMEALALAGGITERGKAKMVKIMRQTEEGREVYQVDMSTIDGLIYADMIVQANDYIYVEPTKQLSREFLKEVTPIISLISSAALIITLIMSFN